MDTFCVDVVWQGDDYPSVHDAAELLREMADKLDAMNEAAREGGAGLRLPLRVMSDKTGAALAIGRIIRDKR